MGRSDASTKASVWRWVAGTLSLAAAIIAIVTFVTGRYSLNDIIAALRGGHLAASATGQPSGSALHPRRNFGPNLDATMNEALSVTFDARYRVIEDKDGLVTPYDLEHFVLPNRRNFRFYPYLVIGDFDGDKVSDLAALVRNTENNYVRLVVLWGRPDRDLTFYDGQLCTAIAFVPANEVRSHWEKAPISLLGDAIMVECYEKSAWLLYWDGHSFQTFWISD